jgi:hypothetical protein
MVSGVIFKLARIRGPFWREKIRGFRRKSAPPYFNVHEFTSLVGIWSYFPANPRLSNWPWMRAKEFSNLFRCRDVASLNYASLNYQSQEKLDDASLGLCVPRTFCPWPFCDNLSPFFASDHTSPFWKVRQFFWTFHPWTVENHCHNCTIHIIFWVN